MHNIDRTTNEYEFNPSYEYEGEGEYGNNQEWEWEGEGEYEYEGEGETLELEFASELLAVGNEQELDMFLGKLVSRVAKGVKNFSRTPFGRDLIGKLKGLAKKALPIVGTAAGTFFGGPLGAKIGGKLGSMASNMFELELEGLSNEDREFEVAKRFVRFAGQAARNAANGISRGGGTPSVVNGAIRQAASVYAPGLLRRAGVRSGRWFQTPSGDIVLRRAGY
ncbi:MAG: hypothetical protein ACOYXT_29535 [Bacteroidota bacterium]